MTAEQNLMAFFDELGKISPHLSKSAKNAIMNDIFVKHQKGATILLEMLAKSPKIFKTFCVELTALKQKKRISFF